MDFKIVKTDFGTVTVNFDNEGKGKVFLETTVIGEVYQHDHETWLGNNFGIFDYENFVSTFGTDIEKVVSDILEYYIAKIKEWDNYADYYTHME